MPPRNGKSMSVSETFPSWFIMKNPHRRVIEVSYGEDLAQRFGRLNKEKIREFGKKIFNIELDSCNHSNTNWSIAEFRGGMISRGVGGGITGEGADLLLIDDPIKNREQADSITYREKLWAEWQDTLLTRLHPGGAIIIILTRWHEDDLAGRILKENGDDWTVLKLPAIAEEDDLIGRNPGEALWAEHGFDVEYLAKKKIEVGSRTFASLYQQRPAPAEGNMFKRDWWQFYKLAPLNFDYILQSWDCTFKDTKNSDFVVGQVWGKKGAEFYLLDQIRAKMNVSATMTAIKTMTAKWSKAYEKLVEDKANGPAVITLLTKEISGLIAVNPEGGKEVRAQAITPFAEAGNIYLPDPSIAPWIHDYIEEFASFPNGTNDDQVDATTQAITRLHNKGGTTKIITGKATRHSSIAGNYY